MENKKIYVIKTTRMIEYLSSCGINMIRVSRDKNNPKFNVFLYEDNEQLRNALDKKTKFI